MGDKRKDCWGHPVSQEFQAKEVRFYSSGTVPQSGLSRKQRAHSGGVTEAHLQVITSYKDRSKVGGERWGRLSTLELARAGKSGPAQGLKGKGEKGRRSYHRLVRNSSRRGPPTRIKPVCNVSGRLLKHAHQTSRCCPLQSYLPSGLSGKHGMEAREKRAH